MGAAYYIALDNGNPGFDTMVNGKAGARVRDAIVAITDKLKLPGIDDLASFADLAAEFGVDPDLPAAQEKWFEPAEGIQWVRAVRDHIQANRKSVKKPEAVLADLNEYEDLLTKAQSIASKWHFAIDI
jgi:hypothetical protein